MNALPYDKIYFVGIKGVGMASLAVIAKQAGITVQGSDVEQTFITDSMLSKHAIVIDTGFETKLIDSFAQKSSGKMLVIASAAHGGLENPQVLHANRLGIDTISFGQALGMFQYGTLLGRHDIQGISVAGSHGKTTTSAMLATVLTELDQDPSYLIGTSEVGALGDAGHLGSGKYFIVESDEYHSDLTHDRVPKFHYQHPSAAIITNIDFDHPDVFKSLDDITVAFTEFAANIQLGGVLCLNGDDKNSQKLIHAVDESVRVVTYGEGEKNMYRINNLHQSSDSTKFMVKKDGVVLGEFSLSTIGRHNVINATSVIALLDTIGFESERIAQGLQKFSGSKRRMEIRGKTAHGALVIDDYAHHPTEIAATLTAIKDAYPTKKIICIFQPHTLSRTISLINEFSHAFTHVYTLLLLPIFASAREEAVDEYIQKKLYNQIMQNTPSQYMTSMQNVLEYCTQNSIDDEYVVITMGAGDIYKISEKLIA